MLKLIPRTQIKDTVKGFLPVDDSEVEFELVATWSVLSSTQQEQILNGTVTLKEAFRKHLLNLEGLADENEKPIKYSHELIDTLYENIPVRNALSRSMHTCQTVEGRKAAKAKN